MQCYLDLVCNSCKREYPPKKLNANWIECDRCRHWYHATCANVSDNKFATIKSNSGMDWMCRKCLFDGMIVIYVYI